MKRRTLVSVSVLSVIFVLVLAGLWSYDNYSSGEGGGGVESAAVAVLETCKDASYRPACYEEEVPKLLGTLPLESVFDVIRTVKARDQSYRFCHVLAHELGTREVAKDPQNWTDVIAKGPADGLCSNGFIHGAAVARFNKEVLTDEEIEAAIPELSIACEAREGWNPTPLDQAICYHGIGHVLLHLTEARLERSLEVCDEVAVKEDGRDYTRVCDEGVFMQIFQPLEPEDHALIDKLPTEPTKETLDEFCEQFGRNTAEESACWREGWPFFREELKTPEGIVAFCEDMPNKRERQNCLNTALVVQGRHGLDDPDELSNLCNTLPSEDIQRTCFNLAAVAYIEEDKGASKDAVAFCERAHDTAVKEACYTHLIEVSDFVFGDGTTYTRDLCNALPDAWGTRCTERVL